MPTNPDEKAVISGLWPMVVVAPSTSVRLGVVAEPEEESESWKDVMTDEREVNVKDVC